MKRFFITSVLTILSFFPSTRAQEEDIHLATISTDYVTKTYDLVLTLNDRKLIDAIKTINNKKKKTKRYGIEVLGKPITLVKAVGVTLISLRCLNFTTSKGCDIEIEYPSNLTIGSFKTFNAKLERNENGWQLTHKGAPFKKLHLVARKVLGLLIGIKRIETH